MEGYHIDPDGQLRNVDDLRDLAHTLAVSLAELSQHPVIRMSLRPDQYMILVLGIKTAHDMVCPANDHKPGKPLEGPLGKAPSIPGLEDLADLFKDL